ADDRILFIDARNVFTQIDRAHREFSEEQIQNLAVISHLRKGRSDKFIRLIDRYFAAGMESLRDHQPKAAPVAEQLLEVLDTAESRQAVDALLKQWAGLDKLQSQYDRYCEQHGADNRIKAQNQAQQRLRAAFDPFFAGLHEAVKQLDKIVR